MELLRAVALRPDLGEAHSNLAAALLETGRMAEARTHLGLAVRAGFTPPAALIERLGADGGGRAVPRDPLTPPRE
jgi:hypothetical protein